MIRYRQTAELNVPITKGRFYGVMVDMPNTWLGFTFAAYLRTGSVFTPMTMSQVDAVEDFMRFKIAMSAQETSVIKASGKAEIQISIVDAMGEVFDVLTLDTYIESNKPIIGGGING